MLLPGRRELRDRAALRGLRRLAAGVGVDLGVEHEDVHVAARRQHVVEPAEADVVGPPVAADEPHALAHEVARHHREARGVDARGRRRIAREQLPAAAPRARAARAICGSVSCGLSRIARARSSPTNGREPFEQERGRSRACASTPRRIPSPNSALSSNSELFHDGPAPLGVGRPRRGRQVRAVDRRATGGVGDDHAVAEELAHELDVRRLAAAGARAGELEQRLEHLRALHRVVRQQVAVEIAGS